MATCYVCVVHNAPVKDDPSAIGACSTCGAFTCKWDGARVHNIAQFRCAICLVRVLIDSAIVRRPSGDPGGGSSKAHAQIREFLGTEHFEQEARHLAAISSGYRYAWRPLLREQFPTESTAQEFGERLALLGGGEAAIAERVKEGLLHDTVDRDLLADAAGVGEYAQRLPEEAAGPETLESVARARAEQQAADAQAAEERARLHKQALESELAKRSTPEHVIGVHKKVEQVEELKEKYAGEP